jgi:N-carbamoylputrescine amidase
MIDENGVITGTSEMVHIFQAEKFFEKDYYTPSEKGFCVYDTKIAKIGIVICFDRHLPESIRSCAAKGAEVIIVPTANIKGEPEEMYEWEMRVQAMQNNVYIAMCNRVGIEGESEFYGGSMLIDPYGNIVTKADDKEGLVVAEFEVEDVKKAREERPYINLRRKEWYF